MFGSQLGFMYFKLCLQIGLFKLVLSSNLACYGFINIKC
ncbi:unnamed protein product [Brassica napus]|uniref:(rape) hypothetical protein n=1 Tax=Brassica napus TaxID=3708 RepID=A0A816Q149_BRANA|nr:unnamed protein product [Brassica napus]